MVTFESDWKQAKQILLHLVMEQQGDFSSTASKKLRQAARHYMIYYKTLTPTVYTSVADSGVVLTIRYLTDPRRRRGTTQALWEAILDEFASTRTSIWPIRPNAFTTMSPRANPAWLAWPRWVRRPKCLVIFLRSELTAEGAENRRKVRG